jgi:hypothetical protein
VELIGHSRRSFNHPETTLNPKEGSRERSASSTSITGTVSLIQKETAVATGFTAVATGFMPVLSEPSGDYEDDRRVAASVLVY